MPLTLFHGLQEALILTLYNLQDIWSYDVQELEKIVTCVNGAYTKY